MNTLNLTIIQLQSIIIIIIPILPIGIIQPQVNFLRVTLRMGQSQNLNPSKGFLCSFYYSTLLPPSTWHAYSLRDLVPHFVFNKANISEKHTRDLEIQF